MGWISSGEKPGEMLNGWRSKVILIPAILGLFLVTLSLAGCYELKNEVIPASVGEIIPSAPDQVDFETGGKIVFTRSRVNNDYLFQEVSYSGTERHGSCRAMRIKDNIYAVQGRYDGESQYQLLFYTISPESFKPMDIAKDTDLKIFASLYGVEYRGDELSKSFSGKPEKILAMLRGLSSVEFEP